MFRRIFSYTQKYAVYIICSSIALILITCIQVAVPFLVRTLINEATADVITPNRIIVTAAWLVGLYLSQGVLTFVSLQVSHYGSFMTVANIQKTLYAHMQRLPFAFFLNNKTGDIARRVTHNAGEVETLITHAVPDIVSSLLTFVGGVVMMFILSVPLALATLATLVPILLLMRLYKAVNRRFEEMYKIDALMTSVVTENIQGMREIQLFGRQEHENGRIADLALQSVRAAMSALNRLNSLSPAIGFFTSLGQVVVVCFGAYLTITGRMEPGDIVGFLLYLGLFYGPVSMLSRSVETYQRARAAAGRVFEIMDERQSPVEGALECPDSVHEVAFDDVTFAYVEEPVLTDISFICPKGHMTGIVGPTGAGKTTLVSLLVRLFDPERGAVTINGINNKEFTLASLRKQFSIVSQDVFLFNGTLYENIAYSVPDSTRREVEECAKRARLHEFILSLPDGYETVIGERGLKLSGGQRQRLAIARALLRRSTVLIFDEATSALDTQTEREIRGFIESVKDEHIIIVIAHRLSTVAAADEILVLEDGRIVQRGTHRELYAQDGLYGRLHAAAQEKEGVLS